jgi:hypothetical protein
MINAAAIAELLKSGRSFSVNPDGSIAVRPPDVTPEKVRKAARNRRYWAKKFPDSRPKPRHPAIAAAIADPVPPPTQEQIEKLVERTDKEVKRRKHKRTPETVDDEQWLKMLEQNVAYKHISVREERAKMQAWCDLHMQQPTRKRLLAWLNREATKPQSARNALDAAAAKQ